jgi:hypothetical protein
MFRMMSPLGGTHMEGVARLVKLPTAMYIPYSPPQLSGIFVTGTLVVSLTQESAVDLHSVGRVP